MGSEKTNRMKQKKKTKFREPGLLLLLLTTYGVSQENQWKDFGRMTEGNSREKAGQQLPQNVQRVVMFTNVRIIQYGRLSFSNRIFSLRGLFYQLHSSQLTPLISYAFARNHALLLL